MIATLAAATVLAIDMGTESIRPLVVEESGTGPGGADPHYDAHYDARHPEVGWGRSAVGTVGES